MENKIEIRTASFSDLDAITKAESSSFPAAEAATREQFSDRLRCYADHFWLLILNGQLVSFVDGFVTDGCDLTDIMYEKASMHDPNGNWQMIFGVVTVPEFRGKGYAGMLLRRAISDAKEQGRTGVVLTCKDALIRWYSGFGFICEGHTEKSTHGDAVWNQMRLVFDT